MKKTLDDSPRETTYPLQPGDIHLTENPEHIFYNLVGDIWIAFTKFASKSRRFIRDEYKGPVPFEFDSDALREKNLHSETYFLGNNGSWNDSGMQSVASTFQQRLSELLHHSLEIELTKLSDQENANYYNPLDITNKMLGAY
tara:strand:+ start:5248 stop:5673 length:426 start_codon:yes stop_codon:yes gene_type:complete